MLFLIGLRSIYQSFFSVEQDERSIDGFLNNYPDFLYKDSRNYPF